MTFQGNQAICFSMEDALDSRLRVSNQAKNIIKFLPWGKFIGIDYWS